MQRRERNDRFGVGKQFVYWWRGAEAELPVDVVEDGVEGSGARGDVFLGEHVDVVEIGWLHESGDRGAFVEVVIVVVRVLQRHPVMEWGRGGGIVVV